MPAVEQRAAEQRSLTQAVVAALSGLWSQVEFGNLEMSWTRLIPAAVTLLVSAQRRAASGATAVVSAAVAEQGGIPRPAGEVDPLAFAGHASDGRPLESLLFAPPIAARVAQARGGDETAARRAGQASLSMMAQTQLADAARAATGVAIAADLAVAGYERVVHLPACGRCIILAGRLYRWSKGFERHPRCDCTMQPVTSEEWRTERLDNTPAALFGRMTPAQQEAAFTKAGAQAIRDGADPSQVVNARSGMQTANVYGRELAITTTGRTRRAIAGQRLEERFGSTTVSRHTRQTRTGERTVRLRGAKAPRLMPESIYQVAEDRDHAIRLLKLHGYIL